MGVEVGVIVGAGVPVAVGVGVGVSCTRYVRRFWMPLPHQNVSELVREQIVPSPGAGRLGCRQYASSVHPWLWHRRKRCRVQPCARDRTNTQVCAYPPVVYRLLEDRSLDAGHAGSAQRIGAG